MYLFSFDFHVLDRVDIFYDLLILYLLAVNS